MICGVASVVVLAVSFQIQASFQPTALQKMSVTMAEEVQSMDELATTEALIYLKDQKSFASEEIPQTRPAKNIFVVSKLQEHANSTQAGLIELLEAKELKFKRFYVANIILVKDIDKDSILEIAKRDDVRKVLANPLVTGTHYFRHEMSREEVALAGIEQGIKAIGADRVWSELGVYGEGIVVGGQDTGVDHTHPAITKQYRGYGENADGEAEFTHDYNWHDAIDAPASGGSNKCGYNLDEPCDDNGHGTHTIGTIVGDDGDGNQIGVATKAKWIGCRNMDEGDGKPSTYIDCFQFFMAPFPVGGDAFTEGDASKAPHVLNNSWGCPKSEGCEGDEFVDVLANVKAAGIWTVVSAGNEGPRCSTIKDGPAHNSATTFSVGAVNGRTGSVTFFSSRGPSAFDGAQGPDVSAPGEFVRSAVPGGGYRSFSGTSMAGPHMAGMAALMISADKSVAGKVDQLQAISTETADVKTTSRGCGEDTSQSVPNNVYGYGIINAFKAVEKVLSLDSLR
jgi:subtilisin family serine protease